MAIFPIRLARPLDRLLNCPGNPWFPGSFGRGTMARLHRLAARHALVTRFGRRAWLMKGLLTLTWPVRLAYQARPWWQRFGGEVAHRFGVSKGRQLADLLRLGLGLGLPPPAYYQLRLFATAPRGALAGYLYDHEVGSLFPYLNGFTKDPAVDDKRLFGERCRASGLPAVPLLAWARDGRLLDAQGPWPAGDLISKPVSGCQGRGVVRWRAQGAGYYNGERALGRAALLSWLRQGQGGEAWLLQPALDNHPRLADLSGGGLVTIRLMTARLPDGESLAFAALLKMPLGRQVINNHGIGSAIDLDTGLLGPAFPYRPLHPGFHRHPHTGAQITGRTLPDWSAIRQLALTAHDLFPDFLTLGWDIALTPAGPVLLETNAGWDVTLPQLVLQRPLGETALRDIIERRLG